METKNISTNIKAALKSNLEHKAPAFLLANIMKQVQVKPALQVAPPTNYALLFFGLMIALACIALPFLLDFSAMPEANFRLPVIVVSPLVWLSASALMLLYAADQLLSRKQLKQLKHR